MLEELHWIMNLNLIIYVTKIIFLSLCTYYTNIKILNLKFNEIPTKNKIILIFSTIFIAIVAKLVNDITKTNINSIIYIILIVSGVFSIMTKSRYGYSILISSISISINQIIFFSASMITFIIYKIFGITNENINFIIIIFLHLVILLRLLKLKRIRRGLNFLKNSKDSLYLDIIILFISVILIFIILLLTNCNHSNIREIIISFFIVSVILFITIQKSLQLYYKQKMLVKDLEETKAELEEKNNKIKELEKEIIKSGKRSHSISHRQKILEHKLEELSMKSEISEMDIKSRIEKIGKDIRKEPVIVLAKTGIVEIDDVLNYMKSECLKKKIDFQLQLSGNIYKMINNYVSKDELEILLADHIKNAIIAIEYSENINKSILVRLGRLDGTYGLYVYDSGIEFEIETFLKLGKKPATTHKDSGGTGMGFMNTFDTLRKHNASFIIEEYGKPVTDNFTKVLKFKFDNKNEFKICTYRKEEIEKQDKEKILKVENLMF